MNRMGEMLVNDRYGSTFREKMKRSMEQPAKFKPLNHKDHCHCVLCHQNEPRQGFFIGIAWIMVAFTIGSIAFWVGLNYLESFARP